MNLILRHFWHNSVDKPRNQSPWPHYFMLCEKKGSVAKVKSGKRENHMVVDAKQGYNLFLMWEETSEFWHKQQPTFVKISWTSKKHYGEKWQEKSNFWFLSIFGVKIQTFCYIIFFLILWIFGIAILEKWDF